jgi:DNA-binding Lrp family transcriptional regulator
MTVDQQDRRLLAAIQDGVPVTPRPFLEVGKRLGLSEADVIDRLKSLVRQGIVKRFGLVLHHHELGYCANAMVVWNVPDAAVADVAGTLTRFPFVTLCYRRPRCLPRWPYNLFCMIHGRDRETVLAQIERLKDEADLGGIDNAVLFSTRRFKQQGARYDGAPALEMA